MNGNLTGWISGADEVRTFRNSNKVSDAKQDFRVNAVHCWSQEAEKRAEENIAHLKIIDYKLDKHVETSDLILRTVRSGIPVL